MPSGVPPPDDGASTPAENEDETEGSGAEEEGKEGQEGEEADAEKTTTRQARAPWHFKVVVVGSVVYLGYRLYQGISWLAHHI